MCIWSSWPGAPRGASILHVHLVVVIRSPGRRGFDLNCASCGRGPEPREGSSILHVQMWSRSSAPGRGFDLICAFCCRGPDPWEGVSILGVHLVVAARSPGKGLRSKCASCGRGPEPRERGLDLKCASGGRFPEPRDRASILIVHLAVVVVRSPGKGFRS